ncbi:MAG: type II toxin-antitoxin system prevent-host-death family antitoxin [Synergistaceae bacterium]|jgi:prevent-host-death family protein|nr:type II toxin-antitoxin system prevent-host-death family antitoxin [Synergistaceae bacterium]
MQIVGAYEAKTKLSALLDRVESGESFMITRHGSPVAVLTRPAEDQFTNAQKAIEGLLATRQKFAQAFEGLDSQGVKALIEEGRR